MFGNIKIIFSLYERQNRSHCGGHLGTSQTTK